MVFSADIEKKIVINRKATSSNIMSFVTPLLFFIGLTLGQTTTIAVLEFEGKGVSQSDASNLTDRLRDELFKTGIYIGLERGLMDDILKEQGFQQSGCTSSECVVEVGNMLGVQQMVGGSIGKVGNIYTVSARIIDIESGKVLKSSNYDHIGDIEQLLINGMEYVVNQLVTKNSPQLSSQNIRSKSKIRYLSIDKDKAGKMKQKNKILIGSIFSLWIIWGLLPPV